MNATRSPYKAAKRSSTDRLIGRSLRLRRIGCGISRARLAAHLGFSSLQLRAYECGDESIPPKLLARVAERCLVDVGYFFERLDADGEERDGIVASLREARGTTARR